MINKVKLLNESYDSLLKEGFGSCTLEDLYKSVLKTVSELNFPSDRINVKLNHEDSQVLISYNHLTSTNAQWTNLDDKSIISKLKNTKFSDYFAKFEDFCNKGARGAVGMFNSGVKMVNIITTSRLDIVKDDVVFRYTDSKVEKLMKVNDYVNEIGKDNLGKVYIEVGIFLTQNE
jgi:hypothetical protein